MDRRSRKRSSGGRRAAKGGKPPARPGEPTAADSTPPADPTTSDVRSDKDLNSGKAPLVDSGSAEAAPKTRSQITKKGSSPASALTTAAVEPGSTQGGNAAGPASSTNPLRAVASAVGAKASAIGAAALDPGLAEELGVRRNELARMEEQALREQESLRIRAAEMERRENALSDRERNLDRQTTELKQRKKVLLNELEKLTGLSSNEAKQVFVSEVEHEARQMAGLAVQRVEEETRRIADAKARSILAMVMGRLAGAVAGELTTKTISLPNDEMKGRIIGREGRNIRALEALTGVDIIVDETPETVTLSSFDGVRREIARITLERLIADGRIQPSTIEEFYETAKSEIGARILEYGREAELAVGLHGIPDEILEILGRLHFRTSYGQNVLAHLIEASRLAGLVAAELGASVETAKRATLLHDLGKAMSHEVEGNHADIGARLAHRYGESDAVVHAIESHHNEVAPRTVEAVIVQIADSLSGARPGARGEALEQYVGRMRDLEQIASRHAAVDRVAAMRAGREIRVIVDPGKVTDEDAAMISHEVARAIEREVDFPGRIKITVIRETRATEFAS